MDSTGIVSTSTKSKAFFGLSSPKVKVQGKKTSTQTSTGSSSQGGYWMCGQTPLPLWGLPGRQPFQGLLKGRSWWQLRGCGGGFRPPRWRGGPRGRLRPAR